MGSRKTARKLRITIGLGLATLVGFPSLVAAQSSAPESLEKLSGLPEQPQAWDQPVATDWLIDPAPYTSRVTRGTEPDQLVIGNGLVKRTFKLQPNLATVGLEHLGSGESFLRAVGPEGSVTLNGLTFGIGGLEGQSDRAYLTEAWIGNLRADAQDLQFCGFEVLDVQPRLAWKRVRHHAPDAVWPPPGVRLRLDFRLPDEAILRELQSAQRPEAALSADELTTLQQTIVSVYYELYDGVPVWMKWLEIRHDGPMQVTLDRFVLERLAIVEAANWVEAREGVPLPHPDRLHVETDFAFGGFNFENANRHVVRWKTDPAFETQTNYLKQMPCVLEVAPTYGPAQVIPAGETWRSFHAFELLHDDSSQERQDLALRRMVRTVAPWVTENPLMMHLRTADPQAVKVAIDQCAEVGFEMLILSFGSGFNIENRDADYLAQWKTLADYAAGQGIEMGGYSLLSSRRIGGGNDIVSPEGQTPTHGNCPALTSPWGVAYFAQLRSFLDASGFRLLEHDGSYPGDVDVTPRPPLQQGIDDSRWAQWRIISDFYGWCRSEGIYLNVPDYYYLAGSNKCGMGYREVNWSLPRAQQVIHTRQNIFDGTRRKTPSMGWMFVPLTEYHGGGAAATIEPLVEHLDHYERMLNSNLGAGVQACYRGPRLFDTPETRDRVRTWVDWFKSHREILESDVIHGASRRADARDLDWLLHANPQLECPGMLVVYNPLERDVTKTIRTNLYYTGIAQAARVTWPDGATERVSVGPRGTVDLTVSVPAGGMTWCTFHPDADGN